MIRWAFLFIFSAIISAIIGYGEMIGAASNIAKALFFIFTIFYIISLLRTGIYKYEELS